MSAEPQLLRRVIFQLGLIRGRTGLYDPQLAVIGGQLAEQVTFFDQLTFSDRRCHQTPGSLSAQLNAPLGLGTGAYLDHRGIVLSIHIARFDRGNAAYRFGVIGLFARCRRQLTAAQPNQKYQQYQQSDPVIAVGPELLKIGMHGVGLTGQAVGASEEKSTERYTGLSHAGSSRITQDDGQAVSELFRGCVHHCAQ